MYIESIVYQKEEKGEWLKVGILEIRITVKIARF